MNNYFRSVAHFPLVVYLFKIASSEFFIEISVLYRYLPFMGFQTVIVYFYHFARQGVVGDIKYSVEVQSFLFGRPFPHSDVLPTLSMRKIRERPGEFFTERYFAVLFAVVSKSYEIIKLL